MVWAKRDHSTTKREKIVHELFPQSKNSAEWVNARGAPYVRGDAIIRRRAATNHTNSI